MTSTSVGWVLLDGQGPDAAVLDHDAFDMQTGVNGTETQTPPHAAAARGAQTIATASGHRVGSVHVTWTEDVEADAPALLKSLADLGFDTVHSIRLTKAAQAWGIEVGRESEHEKTGLCILERGTATIMIIATGAGTVRTAVTESRDCAEDLIEWLRTVFRKDGWLPESLYLVGAHADLDHVTQPIADALPIPVSDSVDTQLALARGAALASAGRVGDGSAQAPAESPWRVLSPKKPASPAAVAQADAVTTQTIETSPDEPRADRQRRQPPWVVVHAKKVTIGAAAVAVFGAALSLAAGSALNVENAATQAADPWASGASVTSASVHTVPAPVSSLPASELQPLAAEPAPIPPPPPEPLSLPAEPVAVVAPEPVAAPASTVSVAPPTSVSAPTPTAIPAAPLAAPVAPLAPPPAAPAPVVAPPPPADPAELPPPDPIQQVLSPLFSGLP